MFAPKNPSSKYQSNLFSDRDMTDLPGLIDARSTRSSFPRKRP
jgi:hypothetical protein